MVALFLAMACHAPETHVAVVTQTLNPAQVHTAYRAELTAVDGTAPIQWTSTQLPKGLELNPAGFLSGTLTDEGQHDITVTATDANGTADSADLTLDVTWSDNALPCGATLEGSFTRSAQNDWYDVDFEQTDDLAWVDVPLPPDDVQDLTIAGVPGSVVYLALPGTPAGDTDLVTHYSGYYVWAGDQLHINGITWPDLGTFRSWGLPIRLLVVADTDNQDWSLVSSCSTAPVYTETEFGPLEVGHWGMANLDTNLANSDTRYEHDGGLPDWADWNPDYGIISGTPDVAASWEFDVTAISTGGSTTEAIELHTYKAVDVACGDALDFSFPGGVYFNGWSSDNFAVLRLPLDDSISSITLTQQASVNRTSLAAIGPEGNISSDWGTSTTSGDATVEVSPRSYPRLTDHIGPAGHLDIGVIPWYYQTEASVQIACSQLPDLHGYGLPIFAPGEDSLHQLDAIGGASPYEYSASNLPDGVTLSADGALTVGASTPEGSYDIDVSIEDDKGSIGLRTEHLAVGDDAACQGAIMLACGQAASGSLQVDENQFLCLPDSDHGSIELQLVSGETADIELRILYPGHDLDNRTARSLYSYHGSLDERAMGEGERVPLPLYEGLPIFFRVSADEAGSWSVTPTCR
jgi:hypothetical protein